MTPEARKLWDRRLIIQELWAHTHAMDGSDFHENCYRCQAAAALEADASLREHIDGCHAEIDEWRDLHRQMLAARNAEREQYRATLAKVQALSEQWRGVILVDDYGPNTVRRQCADELSAVLAEDQP